MSKLFAALFIYWSILHMYNKFDSPIKLFSDLVKFLDTSAKQFFLLEINEKLYIPKLKEQINMKNYRRINNNRQRNERATILKQYLPF